ncbi:MAG: glycosyl transferase family 2 [Chloroflexi bacterium]|nr:MAG: glycosyl transferase family 2 [Chloroflexota bacterium]
MEHFAFLRDEVIQRIEEIGRADILVGIPSYNNAGTIAHVVSTAAEGMTRYFPDFKAVVVNSDGGSPDGTMEVASKAPVPSGVEKIVTQYVGPSGKGSAFRTIFAIAKALGVKVCVVVDSDLRSIAPWWIERLAGPIVKGLCDYVAPYYIRHKYDATITNNICYPMTRALYGLDIRQPIGGDFGISPQLLENYLGKPVWESDVARYGIDIWMTTTAVCEGAKVCQAHLGVKIHDVKDPAITLGPMFRQVVGTLFSLMSLYEEHWKGVTETHSTPFYGEPLKQEPEPVKVTLSAMIEKLRKGLEELEELWSSILAAENLAEVKRIASLPEADYAFPAELWAKVVYDFAVAYNKRGACRRLEASPEEIITAMTPLYYGRTAGLVVESRDLDSATFEEQVVQRQARIFEQLKPYLLNRW